MFQFDPIMYNHQPSGCVSWFPEYQDSLRCFSFSWLWRGNVSPTIPADASFCPAATQTGSAHANANAKPSRYSHTKGRTRFLHRPPGTRSRERRQHEVFLTDVVTVMERAVVGQSRYSQVPLGPQAVQLVPDEELPLSQGEESLHVV